LEGLGEGKAVRLEPRNSARTREVKLLGSLRWLAGKEEDSKMASPTQGLGSVPAATSANEFIEQQLDERLRAIEAAFDSHALSFCGPLVFGVDDILRAAVEKRHREPPAKEKLVVILTTGGGYIEIVQRMVDTLRMHYKVVDFVVPNYAYSAGTVFVMSGDAIHMDYYSRLGPIDPQLET
jgi:ClpP class serine protease